LLFGTNSFLPRPYLHFIYNALVVFPTVIAFLVQARRVRDEYLEKIFKDVDDKQLVWATAKLERQTYGAGEVIIHQGARLTSTAGEC
jgi:hypothetical protein